MPGFPAHNQLLELAQIHVHQVSDATQLSHPLSYPSPLPSIFSSIRVFPMSQFFASGDQIVAASASAISPSNEYSGLLSFRIDWFDLPEVQGTLKSLL